MTAPVPTPVLPNLGPLLGAMYLGATGSAMYVLITYWSIAWWTYLRVDFTEPRCFSCTSISGIINKIGCFWSVPSYTFGMTTLHVRADHWMKPKASWYLSHVIFHRGNMALSNWFIWKLCCASSYCLVCAISWTFKSFRRTQSLTGLIEWVDSDIRVLFWLIPPTDADITYCASNAMQLWPCVSVIHY